LARECQGGSRSAREGAGVPGREQVCQGGSRCAREGAGVPGREQVCQGGSRCAREGAGVPGREQVGQGGSRCAREGAGVPGWRPGGAEEGMRRVEFPLSCSLPPHPQISLSSDTRGQDSLLWRVSLQCPPLLATLHHRIQLVLQRHHHLLQV